MTTPAEALIAAREHGEKSWYTYMAERNLDAKVPDWRTGVSPDGSPTLTVQVVGPGAGHALERFARDFHLTLAGPGDQRPQFDLTVPGRTVLVWRYAGVWVELWHPDTADAHDTPPVTVPEPGLRRLLAGASGRLPFTRARRTQEAS